jgi:dienelactone hydrolase
MIQTSQADTPKRTSTVLRAGLAASSIVLAIAWTCLFSSFKPAIAGNETRQVTFRGADGVILKGWMYAPTQRGQHPAVIAMHGCGGLTDANGKLTARHQDWGQRLSGLGFFVLFPDSFGSRGLGSQCKIGDRDVRAGHERVDDAVSALSYLSSQTYIKIQAISLIGWSNGGSTVLYSVEPRHRPHAGVDFATAVALYPGCRGPLESGQWKTRLPLLILIGLADDWTPAAPCIELSKTAKSTGLPVDIVTYRNAYHEFDEPNAPLRTLNGLASTVAGTGRAHVGTNPEARADAITRVPAFLPR